MRRTGILVSALLAVGIVGSAQAGGAAQDRGSVRIKVNEIRVSPKTPTLSAWSAAGPTSLDAREIDLDAWMPSGRQRRAEMIVFFDPARKFFGWLFSPQAGDGPGAYATTFASRFMAAYAGDDGLTILDVAGRTLALTRFTKRAETIEEAVTKALDEAPPSLKNYEAGARPHVWQTVPLGSALEDSFWICPICAYGPQPSLQNIERLGSSWEITMKGQWIAKVVIGDKLDVRSVTRQAE